MSYKGKTKLRMKLMKEIRQKVTKIEPISSNRKMKAEETQEDNKEDTHDNRTSVTRTQLNQLRLLFKEQSTQFDTTQAYINDHSTTYQQGKTLSQCMNALQSLIAT
jgi:hypothetical protein